MMKETLSVILTASFVFAIIRITTPILFATLGACISDQAGMTNVGLDGIMTASALTGVLGSAVTGSAWLGFLAAMLTGALLGLLLGYCSLTLKADLMLSGIALNLICGAGSALILFVVSGDRSVSTSIKSMVMPDVSIPLIRDIPVLGEVLSGHSVLTYLSFIMVFVLYGFINRTVAGLRIRSIGQNAAAATSMGVRELRYRYLTLMLSGLMAGMGGAFLSMSYVSFFTTGITAGRGFIAVAASAMGGANPISAMLAALLFGAANALANAIPTGFFPQDFIQMIPYIATIVGLTIRAATQKRHAAAAVQST